MTDNATDPTDELFSPRAADDNEPDAADTGVGLWQSDTGELADRSRRALLELVRGPYLSRERSARNWDALRSDEAAIRSRLHDLFLELVIDPDAEFAFARAVAAPDNDFPTAVRTRALTFLDTAMLLALRQRLITEGTGGRVVVGQDELYDELQAYRMADRDEATFARNLNSAWATMTGDLAVLKVLGSTRGDGAVRAEISPVVRMLVDADRVRAMRKAFDAVASGDARPTVDDDEEDATPLAEEGE